MIGWWLAAALAANGNVGVQGMLTGVDGSPIDGVQPVTFRLRPAAGGAAVHTELQTVTFTGGAFATSLGSASNLDLDLFAAPAGLAFTVQVGAGAESGPIVLQHVPLAARAASAARADVAASVAWTDISGRPAGLDDGDGTLTPTGAGLTLSGTNLSIDHTALTPSWSNVQGRPNPTAAGQFLRASGAGTWTTVALSAGDLPLLSGDVTGAGGVTVVGAIHGRPIAASAPAAGDLLTWSGTTWVPSAPTGAVLQSRPVAATTPSAGDVLTWNGSTWAPAVPTGGVALTGNQTIAGTKTFSGGVSLASSAALVIPNGGTRPASPAAGTLFYNSATTALEYYDGTVWRQFFASSGELDGLKVYFDAGNAASYPGTGTVVSDLSGSNAHGALVGGVTKGTLGGYDTFILNGTNGSIQFPNSVLNTQRMTAVMWVYSQHGNSDTNQGGLYVNRTDNTPNANDWVWFGRYATNIWYFRVNQGTCCTDLAGSGNTSFSAVVPPSTWKMVHFGFEVGGQWKWGADGASAYSAAFAGRPNSQTASSSAIGIGHNSSGSYWYGGVASARFYDRLLTEAELAGEFQRLRSRYGR